MTRMGYYAQTGRDLAVSPRLLLFIMSFLQLPGLVYDRRP
jgi:hypothetical protein